MKLKDCGMSLHDSLSVVEEVAEPRKKKCEERRKSDGKLAVECCTYRSASTPKTLDG
jgi:hypothetical protein